MRNYLFTCNATLVCIILETLKSNKVNIIHLF